MLGKANFARAHCESKAKQILHLEHLVALCYLRSLTTKLHPSFTFEEVARFSGLIIAPGAWPIADFIWFLLANLSDLARDD